MRATEEMYALAEQEGIEVRFMGLQPFYEGLYIRQPGNPPTIVLDRNIPTERKFRAVFAEELGHHFTTAGEWVLAASSHNDRFRHTQVERLALQWAMDYLIDRDEFSRLVRHGLSVEELADWFYIPQFWIVPRFRDFRARSLKK